MTETIEQWNTRVENEQRAKLLRKVGAGAEYATVEPKQGGAHPFKRAQQMYMEILELKAKYQHDTLLLQTLINAFPQYRSRGRGGRHRTKNRTILGRWNRAGEPSKYMPHQGVRECARRALPKSQYWAPGR